MWVKQVSKQDSALWYVRYSSLSRYRCSVTFICGALEEHLLTYLLTYSKALRLARVNEGSHSFTCHPHVHPQVEWTIPAFTPQPQSAIALWLVFNSRPAEGRRLSLPWWLGEYWCCLPALRRAGNPSPRRGGRESNSRPSSRKSNAP